MKSFEFADTVATGDAVESAGAFPAWISVKDRLPALREIYKNGPKSSGSVLVFNGHFVCTGELEETYKKRQLSWKGFLGRCDTITHWMPLPPPPARTTVTPTTTDAANK